MQQNNEPGNPELDTRSPCHAGILASRKGTLLCESCYACNIKIASILLCSFAGMTVNAACLKYEPDEVILVGKLHRETFPGSPNFESVANGDEPETGFYLTLAQPVCTQGDGGMDSLSFDAVQEVQLVLTKEQYDMLRPKLGLQLALRGKLFSAINGHHHADILLIVDR